MPFTAAHNYLQIIGDIVSETDVEIWSTGVRFAEGNRLMGQQILGADGPNPVLALDSIEADLRSFWTQSAPYFPTTTRLTGFKFNAIGTDGKYANTEVTYRRDFAAPLGGVGGNSCPPQVSVAVTLRTNAERGLASRGRMYLPPIVAAEIGPGGRLNSMCARDFTILTGELLTNLSNWSGVDNLADYGKACVMSQARLGATRRVNRVDVGDVFDTIRSRRGGLRENRSLPVLVTS